LAEIAYSHPDTKPIAPSLGFGISTRTLPDLLSYFQLHQHEVALAGDIPNLFSGFCQVCQSKQTFAIEKHDNEVNWRETLRCSSCGLINRWRSSVHLFEAMCAPQLNSSIYITEQVTSLYRLLQQSYRRTVGSEFVPDIESGKTVKAGSADIRVEDVTKLSFSARAFDAVLSFDVLEHVPDYRQALQELFRVLTPGGWLIWSAPFSFAEATEIRASVSCDGSIQHHMPPDYHGDPFSDKGVLCFQSFGMDILHDMEALGFAQARVCGFSSLEFAYLGGNIIFAAQKPKQQKSVWQRLSDLISVESSESSKA